MNKVDDNDVNFEQVNDGQIYTSTKIFQGTVL